MGTASEFLQRLLATLNTMDKTPQILQSRQSDEGWSGIFLVTWLSEVGAVQIALERLMRHKKWLSIGHRSESKLRENGWCFLPVGFGVTWPTTEPLYRPRPVASSFHHHTNRYIPTLPCPQLLKKERIVKEKFHCSWIPSALNLMWNDPLYLTAGYSPSSLSDLPVENNI